MKEPLPTRSGSLAFSPCRALINYAERFFQQSSRVCERQKNGIGHLNGCLLTVDYCRTMITVSLVRRNLTNW